ncbi:preprotein translocase subunit SecG [candidate division WWE3 bacterium CG08_land_8_20_14_0_20_40_13]|uniref:Protein-export membrane protein SecG n=1 Tax=candidate division WWE3 bacterium CG08_land_8_20_14_0_20_40_13 TaxID=1975084 RepID=A0A2H0XFT5_UNCKA|nr:MAG: preprotein translocase subunit SecG [candidate division WWE3 bacterium CG08_land_8_20_14_0_20_40_13]
MNLNSLLTLFQILTAVMIIMLVILQGGGAGLSGSGGSYANYFASKRGFDRYIFILTIFFATLFIFISIGTIFVR